MKYIDKSGISISGEHPFVKLLIEETQRADFKERQLIAKLIQNGIKAMHPDDGWVNRETNEVTFTYPQFNLGVNIGDKIALGWTEDDIRIVKIIGIKESLFGLIYYQFKETKGNKKNKVSEA